MSGHKKYTSHFHYKVMQTPTWHLTSFQPTITSPHVSKKNKNKRTTRWWRRSLRRCPPIAGRRSLWSAPQRGRYVTPPYSTKSKKKIHPPTSKQPSRSRQQNGDLLRPGVASMRACHGTLSVGLNLAPNGLAGTIFKLLFKVVHVF